MKCPTCGSTDVETDARGVVECNNCGGHRVGKDMWADGETDEDYEESSMKDNKRVREGAPEFEPEDEFEGEEEFEGEPEGEASEEAFEGEEGMPEDEEFEGEEEMPEGEFEGEDEECDGGIEAGMIVVGDQRYCVVLYPMDDEEEEYEEEEAEGESPEEDAEEGVEGETEEEEDEHEGGEEKENPFAARDEDLKEEELEEAIRIGMSNTEILSLFGEVRRPRAKSRPARDRDHKEAEGEEITYARKKPVNADHNKGVSK